MITEDAKVSLMTTFKAVPVAFGTINLSWMDRSAALDLLDYGVSKGIRILNFTDARYDGRSEALFGEWRKSLGACPGVVVVAEVSGPDMGVPKDPNLNPKYMINAVNRSLERLHVQEIDTLLLPRPSFKIPTEAILDGIRQLLDSGVIRSYGTSTFPAWKAMEFLVSARRLGMPAPIIDESPYNVLDRRIENELIPFCLAYGVGVFAWAPLAQGLLAGRYQPSSAFPQDSRAALRGGVYEQRVTPQGIARAEAFSRIAEVVGLTPAQLALAWTRSREGITMPVVGFRTRQHIDEALRAPKELPPEIIHRIDTEVNPAGSVVVNFFNSAPWMKMKVERNCSQV